MSTAIPPTRKNQRETSWPAPINAGYVAAGPPAPATRPAVAQTKDASATRVAFVVAGISAVLLTGWLIYQSDPEEPPEASVASLFEGRPAIAVLRFENLSGDPEQAYFVDGIVEDLINRLAGWRTFPVIGSFSSRTCHARPTSRLPRIAQPRSGADRQSRICIRLPHPGRQPR